MGKSLEQQDFERHSPKVLEFQMAVRQAARRALQDAEHDTEREAVRSALIRAGNLRTVASKLYTDGPAQPASVHGHRKTERNGNTYHQVSVWDIDGNVMWESPVTYGGGQMYLKTAWAWMINEGHLPPDSRPSHAGQLGISCICGNLMGKAKL